MNITDFREYLLKNLAVLETDTAQLARNVIDRLEYAELDNLTRDSIERVIGSLSAVLGLKFERKAEEQLSAGLKKIISYL